MIGTVEVFQLFTSARPPKNVVDNSGGLGEFSEICLGHCTVHYLIRWPGNSTLIPLGSDGQQRSHFFASQKRINFEVIRRDESDWIGTFLINEMFNHHCQQSHSILVVCGLPNLVDQNQQFAGTIHDEFLHLTQVNHERGLSLVNRLLTINTAVNRVHQSNQTLISRYKTPNMR